MCRKPTWLRAQVALPDTGSVVDWRIVIGLLVGESGPRYSECPSHRDTRARQRREPASGQPRDEVSGFGGCHKLEARHYRAEARMRQVLPADSGLRPS